MLHTPPRPRRSVGLLRLQQIYQELRPGNETFRVQMVKRIANVTMAIEFLHTMEDLGRFSKKRIVLDCPAEMAKEIIVQHVRDVKLGRRTYHYLLSGLVSAQFPLACLASPCCVCGGVAEASPPLISNYCQHPLGNFVILLRFFLASLLNVLPCFVSRSLSFPLSVSLWSCVGHG